MSATTKTTIRKIPSRKCPASGRWPGLDLGITLQGWAGETLTCPVCDQLVVVTNAGTIRTHYLSKADDV